METKVKYIQDFCIINHYTYINVDSDEEIVKIYNKFNNLEDVEPITPTELLYYGIYYKTNKDYIKMEKYFLMAIDKGNLSAMHNLGKYYCETKDDDKMEKYYLMAIDKGNSSAMNNLGYYYKEIKDYVKMEKYYLMAIDKRNSSSMVNLGYYYFSIKDYVKMEKYYLMAIDQQYMDTTNLSINNKYIDKLSKYYKQTSQYVKLILFLHKYNSDKLFDELEEYLTMRMSLDIPIEIINIIENIKLQDIKNKSIGLQLIVSILQEKINILNLHFKYAPGAEGFIEAKTDFLDQIKIIENKDN